MGVEHNDRVIVLYGNGGIARLPRPQSLFPNKMDEAARQQKLLKPPWVRKEGKKPLPILFTFQQKPVRAV
jgi:hypothetical protein